MTKPRTHFLHRFFNFTSSSSSGERQVSATGSSKKLYQRFLTEKKKVPRYECQYCLENKRTADFIQLGLLPYTCQHHFGTDGKRVCKKCLETWLSAQMDSGKSLLELSCPECDALWDPEEVRYLISGKDQKKFRGLKQQARGRGHVPPEVLVEEETKMFLMRRGARFCPWCQWPFIKDGGCEAMQCIKCSKCFNIDYALVFQDDEGNRAGPVLEDQDATV